MRNRRSALVAAAAVLAFVARPGRAEEAPNPPPAPPAADAPSPTVDATVMTLLSGHADPRDGQIYTVVPAYATLSLIASDLPFAGVGNLRIVLSGWAEALLGDDTPGRSSGADLDTGYLQGAFLQDRLDVRVGRQLVTGGAARITQMDGLDVVLRLPHGLGVAAYAGAPVTPRFGTRRGDFMGGGRLYWRHDYGTEIGLSAIDVTDAGVAARTDGAVDVRVAVLHHLALTGYALWSFAASRLGEGSASVVWHPLHEVELIADYRRTAPDLFLPRTSVLAVFSQETRDEVGGALYLRPLETLKITADYHALVDSDGLGHRATAKAVLSSSRHDPLLGDASVGLDLQYLHTPRNGFGRARLFAMKRAGLLSFTVDVDSFLLEQAINSSDVSVTASATAGWDFATGWRAVLVGMTDVTPLVERRSEIMVKLVYNHLWRVSTKPAVVAAGGGK